MSDNARTEAVKPEWLKAWLVLREGRLRDLDSNDPGWPSGVEMFVVGFNAGASRKDEAAPSDADREALKRVAELASGDHITESMAEYRAATSPDNEPTVWELEFWHAGYKRGALAIIDYLAASQPVQVEVTAPPCDGGCNYNSGPEETCSVHGRPVAEVWGIVQQIGTERDKYRAAIEDALAFESVLPAIATAPRNILSAALGGGEHE